jgi:crotonobetainyl-CoA:carnitine CoA-transferase CaiB-like acyl-CoA transferase
MRQLLDRATVVFTSARPRALEQLGWLPREGQTWVTITAYGWSGPKANWVGYGDEVAVAAGLTWGRDSMPEFCADAVADPLTGLFAAVAAAASLRTGQAAHIDVNLFDVSGYVRTHTPTLTGQLTSAAPARWRISGRSAPAAGADNEQLADWL